MDDPLIRGLTKSIRYAVRILAALIAIEIFINIASYLRENVIHIKLVLATAFMAVARKVIVLDYKEVSADYVFPARRSCSHWPRLLTHRVSAVLISDGFIAAAHPSA